MGNAIRATSGRAGISGIDAKADPVRAHRRLAYVPGRRTSNAPAR